VSITTILKRHARPASLHSAEPIKQQLLTDLKEHRQLTSRIYAVIFVFVCIITAIGVGTLLVDLANGQAFRLHILATAGVAVPLMLDLMRRLVREWSQANLLVTLVGHSDESAIQAIIHKLLASTHQQRPAIGATSTTSGKD
jgi:hypothetical protein